jgi:hypothetical protein
MLSKSVNVFNALGANLSSAELITLSKTLHAESGLQAGFRNASAKGSISVGLAEDRGTETGRRTQQPGGKLA